MPWWRLGREREGHLIKDISISVVFHVSLFPPFLVKGLLTRGAGPLLLYGIQ